MYFEIRTDGPSGLFCVYVCTEAHRMEIGPRRRIEYADGRNSFLDYQANDIPIQWQAWLRHTRPDAPSKEVDMIVVEFTSPVRG